MLEKFLKLPEQPKDPETGKFLPKTPLELTWPHFWLEVAEIAVGILIAQVIWEVFALFVSSGMALGLLWRLVEIVGL